MYQSRPGGTPSPSSLSALPQPYLGVGEALRALPEPVRATIVAEVGKIDGAVADVLSQKNVQARSPPRLSHTKCF